MKACPHCQQRYPAEAIYCFLDGAELTAIRDPLLGATIAGRYLVEEVIGQGGMATVYRAKHRLGDRPCAMKVMNRLLATDATVRERFRREAKSTQMLAHPNVVEIFDHGETSDGTPYMVMELLDGRTLGEVLAGEPLPMRRSIPIMIQLARGIARAHDLGVVHRDLKPENVFLCRRPDGSDLVKILDFGIARARGDPRLTSAGELFGTPQYIAPERVSSGEAGPSVDLYALGVIFYEVVTGKLPFEANDLTTFLVKNMRERPPAPRSVRPGVPPDVDALVMQLLEKDPRARPVDAHRVAQDLLGIAMEQGARIPPDPERDPASSHPAPLSVWMSGIEGPGEWTQRLALFEQMMTGSHATRSFADLEGTLADMKRLVSELSEARVLTAKEQRKLEEIDTRGREARQRFGFAVDALGLDASRARDELRAARIDFDRLAQESKRASANYAAALGEILVWEGRSGMEEPYPQLAESYRRCAEVVDSWLGTRKAERSAHTTLEERERTVADLDYQIAELRGALAANQQAIDRDRQAAHEQSLEASARAERLEGRLLESAATFCAPLRGRPELAPLFRRLETGGAASSN